MTTKNKIGIQEKTAKSIIDQLNSLLANFQIHYQNLRAVHWNVRGRDFFQLHVKFEEYYTAAQLNIDEVAERILTLGGVPLHTFQDYIENSSIKAHRNVHEGSQCVEIVLEGLKKLIEVERVILENASEVGDEGTVDLMTGYLSAQEKDVWMLNAWLGKSV